MISQRLKMGENAELNSIINSTVGLEQEGGSLLSLLPSSLSRKASIISIVRHPKNLEIDAIVGDGRDILPLTLFGDKERIAAGG